jgi:hypothetical protein
MKNCLRISAGILRILNYIIRIDQCPNIILKPYQQYTPKIPGRFCNRLSKRYFHLFKDKRGAY